MSLLVPILHASGTHLAVSFVTTHDAFLPPMPPEPKRFGAPGIMEGPASMGSGPGMVAHKTVTTVMVDGAPAVNQGHDVGYMIPHLQAPPNALSAVHIAFSKHKVMFPISSIQIGGSSAGTYLSYMGGQICCNPVGLPTGMVVLLKCTVWSSMTLGDLGSGLIRIAWEVFFDAFWNRVFKGGWFKKVDGREWAKMLFQNKSIENLVGTIGKTWSAEVASILCKGLKAHFTLLELTSKLVDHFAKTWMTKTLAEGIPERKIEIGRSQMKVEIFPRMQGNFFGHRF